jgi:hypothetical protein
MSSDAFVSNSRKLDGNSKPETLEHGSALPVVSASDADALSAEQLESAAGGIIIVSGYASYWSYRLYRPLLAW